MDYLQTKFTELIENEIVTKNIVLFSVKIQSAGPRKKVSVLMDYPEGGITLDDCAFWNRRFSDLIEQNTLLEGPHVVEVASPGLDWPLKQERDFRRIKGQAVRISYRGESEQLIHEVTAELNTIEQGFILLTSSENPELRIPIERVIRAKAEIKI